MLLFVDLHITLPRFTLLICPTVTYPSIPLQRTLIYLRLICYNRDGVICPYIAVVVDFTRVVDLLIPVGRTVVMTFTIVVVPTATVGCWLLPTVVTLLIGWCDLLYHSLRCTDYTRWPQLRYLW